MGCSSSKEAALFCLEGYGNDNPGAFQSIHAALASGDGNEYSGGDWDNSFNPRRSCERRPGTPRFPPPRGCFNPRRSCERRLSAYIANPGRFCFNPRRSCERRRRPRPQTTIPGASFNPRRSCERRRTAVMRNIKSPRFQSTPLLRAATYLIIFLTSCDIVSIHAALASGDLWDRVQAKIRVRFNPRRSCERRPTQYAYRVASPVVSIHAALASGDLNKQRNQITGIVSIHAALASGDCEDAHLFSFLFVCFYSKLLIFFLFRHKTNCLFLFSP